MEKNESTVRQCPPFFNQALTRIHCGNLICWRAIWLPGVAELVVQGGIKICKPKNQNLLNQKTLCYNVYTRFSYLPPALVIQPVQLNTPQFTFFFLFCPRTSYLPPNWILFFLELGYKFSSQVPPWRGVNLSFIQIFANLLNLTYSNPD